MYKYIGLYIFSLFSYNMLLIIVVNIIYIIIIIFLLSWLKEVLLSVLGFLKVLSLFLVECWECVFAAR